MLFKEEHNDNLFPTVTPTVIENVEMTLPPEIARLAEVFKLDVLKDIQHEVQSPGKPNQRKVGKKIADMTAKTRQDLKKKGVLQVTGRKLYVVGGVVRDWLINHFHGIAHPPGDWDLATDAGVDALRLIIRVGVEEGLLPDDTSLEATSKMFGNVLITISNKTFNITTFPFVAYQDAPRMYIDSLRRNFNVNALYYSIDEKKIYDYHTGIADIYRRSPQFIGRIKNKLKDEGGVTYPLVFARLHSRMNSKRELDKKLKSELNKFIFPYDTDRHSIHNELRKGIKEALDKGEYFKMLHDLGLLKQLFPSLKVNADVPMGEMTLFPQIIAQVLQPNWNNLGHVSEVLHALEFTPREIHDIIFLMKLPHYTNEDALKTDRIHTGLSERAVEQFVKTNHFRNGDWIIAVIKNQKKPLSQQHTQQQLPQPQNSPEPHQHEPQHQQHGHKEGMPPVLQVAHYIIESKLRKG
jgi:tRNA nucleotidyltransferase/poly(A) polymerase